jgi:phage terminase large subunit-like protein
MDKQELVEYKKKVIDELRIIQVGKYCLSEIDDRLNIYSYGLINNPDDHNLYELLALKRFFHFLDIYLFKINEVKAFITFYESLKFSGTKGRQKYKMTPIQVFQFANIMGFYIDETRRLIREALLFVPRKFSKTTSVASLAIYDMLFGDNNAQAYTASNTYKQAQICFREIKGILKALDRKSIHFKTNREIITPKIGGKESFIECLANKPDKLDGLNASLVILDEYSQARTSELKDVLTSSMGVRVNPLTVIITTASDKLDGPFITDTLNPYKSILRGEQENDRIFASIFEPDVDDEESDPHTWYKVQPHLGITVQPDFYQIEYQNALMSADAMAKFRTKYLNIFVQPINQVWIDGAEIERLFKHLEINESTSDYLAMIAVDLSVCDDFSAVSYNLYDDNTRNFHIKTDFYFPEGALNGHPNKELYIKWAEKGYLKLLKGDVIDYDAIARDIMSTAPYMNAMNIGYDPYKSMEFINMLSAMGAKEFLKPISQTYGNFTGGVETAEIVIHTGRVTFEPNPITAWCFGNCVIDEDRLENRKPIKRERYHKIDGAITSIMTFIEFNNFER